MSDATSPADGAFEFEAEASAFQTGFVRALQRIGATVRSRYMPLENEQRFRHGGAWRRPGALEDDPGQFETHGATLELPLAALADNDLSLLETSLNQVAGEMHQQFAVMLFGSVDRAVAKTGNLVDGREKSAEDAYLEMLETVQLRADRDEKVELPTMFAGGEQLAKMRAVLENPSPEFLAGFEPLKARKTEEAIARERARKARFIRYGAAD